MRSANALLCLGLWACLVSMLVADAQATVYFVNPSGDDNNTGTSVANPFRSIKHAATVIAGGDTVYVAAGTYTDEILVNGVQGLSLPATFIGNSGATVNAQWKVINSNYVQIKGFAFQDGGAGRLLVWKGSYEGLIQDCTFDAGRQALLINSGSLTIEDSHITNFEQEGLQVDGESRLVVRDTPISGCQASGVEIRKAANIIFENCDVTDNLGNGVEVNITTESIETGPDGGGRWMTSVPLAGADGPISIGGNGHIDGDLFHLPGYPVDPSDVSGTTYELPPGMSFPPADPEDAATNNDNAGIPNTDKNKDPLNAADQFSLNSNDGIDLPPGTYYFTSVDCKPNSDLRISGPTTIYVAGNVLFKGDVNAGGAPNNLHIYVLGTLVDITSQADVKAGIYAPDATIRMRGGSDVEGMVLAGQLDMAGSSEITTHPSLETLAKSLLPAPPSSPLPPPSWQPVSSGELDIRGSEFTNNTNGVQILTEQEFHTRDTEFSHNAGWGLSLFGVSQVEDCTLSNNAIGGVRLQSIDTLDLTVRNLTLADNTQYGIFAADCGLTFDSTNIGDWVISGSQITIMGQASDLVFDQVEISGGSIAAVQLDQGNMNAYLTTFSNSGHGVSLANTNAELHECTFTGNSVGLYADQNQSLLVTDSTLTNNSVWGAEVRGGGSSGTTAIEGCTVHNNDGGLLIVNAVDGQLLLPAGTVLIDNTSAGLQFDGCNMTLNAAATSGLQITNNQYGINSVNSTLSLDGLSLSGNSTAALNATGGNLTLNNSTLSGSGYGVSANNCGTVTLDTCALSGNTTGLYSNQNADLQVINSTFTSNTQWGASVNPKAGAGLCAIFDGCTFHSNAGGLTLVNAVNGQVSLQSGTLIRDNSSSGLHFANCNLTVNDQAGGAAWRTLRNGYGISSTGSTLTLTGISVEESSLYGVHCEDSSVSLSNCTVTGVGGIYADSANNSLTVESTRLGASGSSGWGVARYGGDLNIKNCVVDGFASGVYLSTAFSGDLATVNNSTLVNLTNDGVHLEDGDATVQNTILVGNSAAYGLTQVSGQLTHSHNMLDGFATPFSGTTADATELLKNPLFVDGPNGDFGLAKGSPAINSGADLTANGVTIDMLGNARPSHSVFEIGAYEYTQSGGSLRVLGWNEKK